MLARNILITGCNRGIGLEMVRQLVTSDHPPEVVIATCRNPDAATELQALASSHSMLKVIKFDVADFKVYPELVEKVKAEMGDEGLNLLINNAGILEKCPSQAKGVPLEQLEHDVFRNVLDTNTTAPLMMVKALLPLLRIAAAKGGPVGVSRAGVVNISSDLSSMGAFQGPPDLYGYRASKCALNMVTKTLSVDFGGEGLLFVAMHPGWVKTDMGSSAAPITPEESIQNMFKVLPSLSDKENGCLVSHDGSMIPK